MVGRRSALKIIFVIISAIVSYLLLGKWVKLASSPDISWLHTKKTLIAEIAEVIIPRTDTPGAKDAGVEEFIIGMIEFCSDNKTQNNFILGLRRLEKYALNNIHKDFVSCDNAEKLEVLSYFEKASKYRYSILDKINYRVLGKPFIIQIKELTVEGYCTSKIGATRGLTYDYIPTTYNACINLKSNQVAWATK